MCILYFLFPIYCLILFMCFFLFQINFILLFVVIFFLIIFIWVFCKEYAAQNINHVYYANMPLVMEEDILKGTHVYSFLKLMMGHGLVMHLYGHYQQLNSPKKITSSSMTCFTLQSLVICILGYLDDIGTFSDINILKSLLLILLIFEICFPIFINFSLSVLIKWSLMSIKIY